MTLSLEILINTEGHDLNLYNDLSFVYSAFPGSFLWCYNVFIKLFLSWSLFFKTWFLFNYLLKLNIGVDTILHQHLANKHSAYYQTLYFRMSAAVTRFMSSTLQIFNIK